MRIWLPSELESIEEAVAAAMLAPVGDTVVDVLVEDVDEEVMRNGRERGGRLEGGVSCKLVLQIGKSPARMMREG